MGYEGDGMTCTNVDECTTGAAMCDPNATCMDEPGSFTCTCDMGYAGDGTTCADEDECTLGTAMCGADSACLNTDGAFECRCLHGFTDVGGTCTPGALLVFSPSDSVFTDAATALGYTVITTTAVNWGTMFDAGGFDAVIISSGGGFPQAEMESRLPTYIAGGGRVIFGVWDLDGSTALQTAFGVTTLEFNAPRPIYGSNAARVNLFNQQQGFTSPIAAEATSPFFDNGDELTLTGDGYLPVRFDSNTGPGAVAVTNGGNVIVNGFMTADMDTADADTDTTVDMQELAMNEINLLMNPVVLQLSSTGTVPNLRPAITRIGYSASSATSAAGFNGRFDVGDWDLVVIDISSDGWGPAVSSRVTTWVMGGNPLIFNYWDLDAETALATTLGVSTTTFDASQDLYAPASPGPADFFSLVESVPSPIAATDALLDSGDELTLTGTGFFAATFASDAGPGAIAVTNADRVIVNGYLPGELVAEDTDTDMIPDIQELYQNQLHYLFLTAP